MSPLLFYYSCHTPAGQTQSEYNHYLHQLMGTFRLL